MDKEVSHRSVNPQLEQMYQGILPYSEYQEISRTFLEKASHLLAPKDFALGAELIQSIEPDDKEGMRAIAVVFGSMVHGERRMKERLQAEKIDVFDALKGYTDQQVKIIVSQLTSMAQNDGCTVGCAWCFLDPNRRIRKAFSFESTKRFLRRYGIFFQKYLFRM